MFVISSNLQLHYIVSKAAKGIKWLSESGKLLISEKLMLF